MTKQAFSDQLIANDLLPLQRTATRTVQINLGKRCNQACRHCHVDAGPNRTEAMTAEIIDRVLFLLRQSSGIEKVDITGGAPELHPEFRRLVQSARSMGYHVMDRCNLTVLSEPGQEDTVDFLATQGVEVFASLPCYGPENVDTQRGSGVFDASIEGLRMLNQRGYGSPGSSLLLNLVYNPLGASLPPAQKMLEQSYKQFLAADFGIHFNALYTITNMPIARFMRQLAADGQLKTYQELLAKHFNPRAVQDVMCRDLVSISWTGDLFDCDFNQMLGLPIGGSSQNIWSVGSFDELSGAPITTASHCLACTAGAGSSCGGALM